MDWSRRRKPLHKGHDKHHASATAHSRRTSKHLNIQTHWKFSQGNKLQRLVGWIWLNLNDRSPVTDHHSGATSFVVVKPSRWWNKSLKWWVSLKLVRQKPIGTLVITMPTFWKHPDAPLPLAMGTWELVHPLFQGPGCYTSTHTWHLRPHSMLQVMAMPLHRIGCLQPNPNEYVVMWCHAKNLWWMSITDYCNL